MEERIVKAPKGSEKVDRRDDTITRPLGTKRKAIFVETTYVRKHRNMRAPGLFAKP